MEYNTNFTNYGGYGRYSYYNSYGSYSGYYTSYGFTPQSNYSLQELIDMWMKSLGLHYDHGYDFYAFMTVDKVVRLVLIFIFSGFGIISNSINLIVFYKQGILTHSCNISLTAMAVSDFFYCVFIFWGCVCSQLVYEDNMLKRDLYKWDVVEFETHTSEHPALMFAETTCWVTTFVAFERLISVTFPFRVGAIFTPKRSCAVIGFIFVAIFIFYFPNLFYSVPKWTIFTNFFDNSNMTRLQYVPSNIISPEHVQFYNHLRVPLRAIPIIVVLLCNIIICLKVFLSQRFRKATATTTTSHTVSPSARDPNSSNLEKDEQINPKTTNKDIKYNTNKEIKLVRMLIVVCTLFSVCYTLDFLHFLIFDNYMDEFKLVLGYSIDVTVELVADFLKIMNASCNIIIYYAMSTRYRDELRLWLCHKKQ